MPPQMGRFATAAPASRPLAGVLFALAIVLAVPQAPAAAKLRHLIGLDSLVVAKPAPSGKHGGSHGQRGLNTDSDGDGLSDRTERRRTHTDPRRADSDGDGLSDWTEVRRTRTNPRRADSDGDGVGDGIELLAGSDPWSPASVPGAPRPPAGRPSPPLPPPPPVPQPPRPEEEPPSEEPPEEEPPGEEEGEEGPAPPLPASAIWSPPAGAQVGVPVKLDGSASTGAPPLACEWWFEDGSGTVVFQKREGCAIDFTFEESGTKYVRLTVEDTGGDSDSSKQSFDVTGASESEPPPEPEPPPESEPPPEEEPPPPPPPSAGCIAGAVQATSATQVRSAVQAGEDVCVVADVGNVNLEGLGSRPVTISSDGGSMGRVDLDGTRELTIGGARLRSAELWYADGTTIERSTIGGTQANRTYDNLVNVNVSTDVTIRGNEIAWTLAGTSGFAGYGIRSPGNSLGYNHRLRVEGNYIHNIAADAIQGLGNSRDVVIDRNRIDYVGQEPASDEHSDAIQIIDHGPGARITNNWISHEGYFAAGQVSGGSGTLYVHGGDNDTLLIENNLFSDSQGRVLIAGLGTGGTSKSNLTIRRNTFLELGKSYGNFPSFHWAVTSGTNNLIERNVAQDEDGGFANQGSLSAGSFVENLWRDRDAGNALGFDAAGDCTSPACNPSGQEPIGYRKPSGVGW